MFRKRKLKALDHFKENCDKIDKDHDEIMKMKPRIKFLCEKFNDIIRNVDMFIMPRVTIKEDIRLPEDFLCYCKIVGLRVKEVREHVSYSKHGGYYITVEFNRKVSEIDCDEVSYL